MKNPPNYFISSPTKCKCFTFTTKISPELNDRNKRLSCRPALEGEETHRYVSQKYADSAGMVASTVDSREEYLYLGPVSPNVDSFCLIYSHLFKSQPFLSFTSGFLSQSYSPFLSSPILSSSGLSSPPQASHPNPSLAAHPVLISFFGFTF